MATPETRSQLLAAVAACDDKKGEDTRILELDPADSGLADFFLITSATNDRQAVAIADEIEHRLKRDFGLYATSVEGRRQAEWILLDYVDIVIHVFVAEKRAFYDIERLRKSARNLTGAEVEAELKSALAEKTIAVRKSAPAAKAVRGRVSAKSAAAAKIESKATQTTQRGPTVTAKPAKKAAKKAAAKPAKKAAKKAVKKAAAQSPAAMGALEPESRGSTGGFGSRMPIAKTQSVEEPGSLSMAASAAPESVAKAPVKAAKKAPAKKAAAKKAAKKGAK